MNCERAGNSGNYLDELYAHWGEIRKETIEQLGAREALKIVDFHGTTWRYIRKSALAKGVA